MCHRTPTALSSNIAFTIDLDTNLSSSLPMGVLERVGGKELLSGTPQNKTVGPK